MKVNLELHHITNKKRLHYIKGDFGVEFKYGENLCWKSKVLFKICLMFGYAVKNNSKSLKMHPKYTPNEDERKDFLL